MKAAERLLLEQKLRPGWYPIIGGYFDGSEYLSPGCEKPGHPVFLTKKLDKQGFRSTRYIWNHNCTAVILSEVTFYAREQP